MIRQLFSFGAILLLASACASRNVNPPTPKAHTGYVDIYSQPGMGISWDILYAKPGSDHFKRAYSDVKPVEGGVLRIALPPGRHLLRINVLNHVITDPTDVELEVADGKVTPVRVNFDKGKSLSMPFTDPSSGGSIYRRQGRGSKISLYEASEYAISATAGTLEPYKPKELTSYLR
jgi:hypothetical protein